MALNGQFFLRGTSGSNPFPRRVRSDQGAQLPLTTLVPLPGMTCSFEGAWLSLIMMVPLSGVSCTGGDYFRLPVTTAIPLSGVGCGPDDVSTI